MAAHRPLILIADDESKIRRLTAKGLERAGFDTISAADGLEATKLLERAAEGHAPFPDLLVLDLMMPGLSGLELLARIRERWKTPVIMLTARGTESDKVAGLDAGADDYLIKPFDLDELSARIRALLRRSVGRSEPTIERGRLLIKPETREVFFNGKPVLLSIKEYALLVALADRPGIVLSRGQLEEKLYNWDTSVGSNAIEVHIHHLRKKLSDDAIKTVRGVGYLLET